MKYIGETGPRLVDQCRQHRCDIRNHESKPVSSHFSSIDHCGVSDILATGIRLYPCPCSYDDTFRKALKYRFIYSTGCLPPHSFNTTQLYVINRHFYFIHSFYYTYVSSSGSLKCFVLHAPVLYLSWDILSTPLFLC